MNPTQRRVRARLAQINLNEGNFNTIQDPLPAPAPMATRLRRINKFLADTVGRTYYQGIPLDAIFDVLEANGFQAVQEDGTPWSGIITGRDASYHMDLVDISGVGPTKGANDVVKGTPAKVRLNMSHYKMQSGRYEVTAYVN